MLRQHLNFSLGSYIITAKNDGEWIWTRNATFGRARSGSCYLVGTILILCSWENNELGFLRLEFQRHQMKLPVWERSTYYCLSTHLKTIDKQSHTIKDALSVLARAETCQLPTPGGPHVYRLDRYRIQVDSGGTISWMSIDEPGKAAIGLAKIESGILFLKQQHDRIELGSSRTFYEAIRSLPPWCRTSLWGYEVSLQPCATASGRRDIQSPRLSERARILLGRCLSCVHQRSKSEYDDCSVLSERIHGSP